MGAVFNRDLLGRTNTLLMFLMRMQNIKFTRIAYSKFWMEQSLIPTSAFRLPTFILLILIFTPLMLWAADTPKVESGILTASLDQASVPVGGVVWLTLDYSLPAGGRLPEKLEVNGLDDLSI